MLEEETRAMAVAAGTLIGNGHTTEGTVAAVEDLGRRLDRPVRCMVEWSHVTLLDVAGRPLMAVPVRAEAVTMTRVSATLRAIDELPTGRAPGPRDVERLRERLERAAIAPASPVWQFVAACSTGACALGVVFGVESVVDVLLIAIAAGLGGGLRRWLGSRGVAIAGQALAAGVIAGVAGGIGAALGVSSAARLVAVCPAMVLVPGPHLINGILDVAARNLAIGWHRLVYATMILLAISAGLLAGLLATGSDLPITATGSTVPLASDVLAAAVAAGSYPVYFSLPLRQIGWPVLVGAAAHALRWLLIVPAGQDAAIADLAACALVGLVLGPVARRSHLSFAGVGFAAVVAMVPGMYVFRAVAGIVALHSRPASAAVLGVAQDVSTAACLLAAIGFGLVLAHALSARPHERLSPG